MAVKTSAPEAPYQKADSLKPIERMLKALREGRLSGSEHLILSVGEEAMQALADQAQDLDLGY